MFGETNFVEVLKIREIYGPRNKSAYGIKTVKNSLKIMNLPLPCMHKKQGNKVDIMHLSALPNLSNGYS